MKLRITTQVLFMMVTLFVILQHVSAQFDFSQHIISDDYDQGRDLDVADVNQDGKQDVFTVGQNHNGSLSWWENKGIYGFEENVIKDNLGNAPRYVISSDFDIDGDIDVFIADIWNNRITYFENDGNQVFTEIVIDSTFIMPHTIDIKDVDGDDDLDILCSSFDNSDEFSDIAWWENNNFEFTKHTVSSRFQQSPFIEGADLDGDDDLDIVACGEVNGEVYWWENDGNQNFTEQPIDNDFSYAHTVLARDIDDDGDFDILGAACMSGLLAWYENDGTGDFTKHDMGIFPGAIWLDMADLDLDGDFDLVGAGMGAPRICTWENDGSQNFTKQYIDGSFNSGFCLTTLDMDNDTDIDIVALGLNSDRVSWFENNMINPYLIDHPECIVFDQLRSRYLVSNPSGNNTGHITAIDGDRNQTYFAEGIENPLGMCMVGDTLFVSDANDQLLGFSLETGDQIFSKEMNQQGNLDGQAYDNNGHLFVIDTYGKIFKVYLETGESSVFVSEGLTQYPQDCIYDEINNRLIVVGWSSQSPIQGVSLEDSTVFTIKETFYGYYDGITQDQFGNVYVSSHYNFGLILKFDPAFSGDPEIVSTHHDEPAGLNYNTFDNILAIPNYGGSSLDFIPIMITGEESGYDVIQPFKLFQNYPNPFKNYTNIQFLLENDSFVRLEVMDLIGKKIQTIVEDELDSGLYNCRFEPAGLIPGIYLYRLEAGELAYTKKMILY